MPNQRAEHLSRVGFWINTKAKVKLEKIAKKQGCAVSDYIRELISKDLGVESVYSVKLKKN